jgi:hypothetical protein
MLINIDNKIPVIKYKVDDKKYELVDSSRIVNSMQNKSVKILYKIDNPIDAKIYDDYQIWDSFKLWVLENRTDNYLLCDSDVIFNNRIEFEKDKDIYFDGIETKNWDWVYEPTMKFLRANFIFKQISFWSYEKQPVYNVGILKINNQILKEQYIQYWKTLYTEIEPYLDLLDKSFTTPILTQYLLTLIVNKDNYSYQYFTKDGGWPYNNKYYNHFPGFLKFKNSKII